MSIHLFVDNSSVVKNSTLRAEKKYQNMLLASASHELRTPLNAINANIAILEESATTESEREAIHAIKTSISLQLSLIEDILDLGKMENDRFELKESTFYLKDLIEEIYNIFKVQIEGKGLKFPIKVEGLGTDIADYLLKTD